MDRVPDALLNAYHTRCDEEGVPFDAFFEEAREAWPAEALRRLLDDVEARMLENLSLMASARPHLADEAEGHAEGIRARMDALRATLGPQAT